jgi:transcriptional regulator with XRE-family HTH domain
MASDNSNEKIKALFGKRLRELRTSKGLSQEGLADLAGLDRTYVSSCERGERNLTIVSVSKLSTALGVDPAELVRKK